MSFRGIYIAALIVAAALALTACGGSDSEPEGEPPASAKTGDSGGAQRSAERHARTSGGPGRGSNGDKGNASERQADEKTGAGESAPGEEAGGATPVASAPAVDGDGTSALSKSEYIVRADRICQSFRRKAEDVEPGAGDEAAARYFKRFTALVRESVRDLKAIPLPAGDQRRPLAYIAVLDEGIQLLKRLVRAIEDDDRERADRLSERMTKNSERSRRITAAYGFKVCGGGSS